jgi:hypothetical protein
MFSIDTFSRSNSKQSAEKIYASIHHVNPMELQMASSLRFPKMQCIGFEGVS